MADTMSTVETEFGLYRPLSQRLPEFYKAYPPSEGFGVVIEGVDPLSLKPGLHALYLECVRVGRTFEAAGLPPMPAWSSIIMVAKLVRNGEVLGTASTHQMIAYEKDYEIAETRARQRLVAAMGFGGEMLDNDEGVSINRPISTATLPADGVVDSQDSLDDVIEGDQSVQADEEQPTIVVPIMPKTPSDLTPQLQAQVDARAASLSQNDVDYSMPTTKSEALKFLRSTAGGNQGASS